MKRLALSSALILVCSWAVADDLVPPPWQRGMPNSTYQEWDFPDGQLQPANPGYINPNGVPIQIPGGTTGPTAWQPTFAGRTGVWCIGPNGELVFMIPNNPVPENEKHIWAQITWFVAPGDPSVTVVPFGPPAGQARTVGTIDLAEGWHHSTFEFILPEQPEVEFFHIVNHLPDTNVYIDQVVIDTLCVPEPASMAAVALGLGALIRRRRK